MVSMLDRFRIDQLVLEEIKSFYNDDFPFEVRYICADWIEHQIKCGTGITTNHPQFAQYAYNFLLQLIQQLELTKQNILTSEELYRIDGIMSKIQQSLNNPCALYTQIQDCLSYEKHFLEIYGAHVDPNETLSQLSCLRQTFGSLHISQDKNYLCENLHAFIQSLTSVQDVILRDHLGKWHRDRPLCGIGAPLPSSLENLRNCFDELANLNSMAQTLIDTIRIYSLGEQSPLDESFEALNLELTKLLKNLIISGFIIEEQPSQVLKTNAKFGATVCHLLSKIADNLKTASVNVSILSEYQAQDQNTNNLVPSKDKCGEISNSNAAFEVNETTKRAVCEFKDLHLKSIKRPKRRAAENVTDEKFVLLFQSNINVDDMVFNVWTTSLPVVVTVHGNQEAQSWATITWDNAFSESGRVPFEVADHVSWYKLAIALNMVFKDKTGKGFTYDNLRYLRGKIYRETSDYSPGDRLVTWSQFCKEPIYPKSDKKFTFWDWFYAAAKTIRDRLKKPWIDGLIIGFISKSETEQLLSQYENGTFLLRFSDSEPGAVAISWVKQRLGCEKRFVHLAPFTSKHLGTISIGDRIKDLADCVNLYPAIPKDEAFGKYYTRQDQARADGYVPHTIRTVVDAEEENQDVLDDLMTMLGPYLEPMES